MAKVKTIDPNLILSPAILDGEIVTLLPSANLECFVKRTGQDEYARNPNGTFLKIPLNKCIQARAEFVTLHGAKEKEDAINELIDKMKDEISKRAKGIIENVTCIESCANGSLDLDTTTHKLQICNLLNTNWLKSYGDGELEKIAAEWLSENNTAITYRDKLKSLLESGDFDTLHGMFHSGLLFTGKIDTPSDIKAIRAVFGADNISETVDELTQSGGALRIIARLQIERKFA